MSVFGIGKKIKRRNALMRELAEWRMADSGFASLEWRLQTRQLSAIQLMGMPEGTIVTILELIIGGQKKGMLLKHILQDVERGRRRAGHDPQRFSEILEISRGPDAGISVPMYCQYRVNLEHSVAVEGQFFIVTEEQFFHEFAIATEVIMGWD